MIQQVEIIERPTFVEEHGSVAHWCPCCGKQHYVPFPEGLVKAGLVGPRLTASVAYLKGPCHASFSTIRKFFRDVVGFRIGRGQLSKLVQKVSASQMHIACLARSAWPHWIICVFVDSYVISISGLKSGLIVRMPKSSAFANLVDT